MKRAACFSCSHLSADSFLRMSLFDFISFGTNNVKRQCAREKGTRGCIVRDAANMCRHRAGSVHTAASSAEQRTPTRRSMRRIQISSRSRRTNRSIPNGSLVRMQTEMRQPIIRDSRNWSRPLLQSRRRSRRSLSTSPSSAGLPPWCLARRWRICKTWTYVLRQQLRLASLLESTIQALTRPQAPTLTSA